MCFAFHLKRLLIGVFRTTFAKLWEIKGHDAFRVQNPKVVRSLNGVKIKDRVKNISMA